MGASGRQTEITRGAQRVVVVEVGGGLREYAVDGQPVLDGYPLDQMADGGRGQALLPWPNRLADGAYDFDGQHYQVPVDELARRNANHGLTRWSNWNVAEQGDARVLMTLVQHPRSGYPFQLELTIEYTLDERGLQVRTRATNGGDTRLPYGAGQHPYFTVGTPLVDWAVLCVPVAEIVELDEERRLPTGRKLPVDGSNVDFRRARQIGGTVLDHCFTGLQPDADGITRVGLSNPVNGRGVRVWMDASYRYIQVYSGESLAPARRRQGLAIEPMTCPPNAFRTGTDLIVLEPGQSHSAVWGVEVDSLRTN